MHSFFSASHHAPRQPERPIPTQDRLHFACRQGNKTAVKALLLDPTIDPNQRESTSREVPLLLAAQEDHVDVVRLLLADDRVDVNQVSQSRGATPLWQACECNRCDTVKLLMEDPRVDVNLVEGGGEIPLWIACHNDLEVLAKILLGSGRKTETGTKTPRSHWAPNCSPVGRAKMRGLSRMVKLIEEYEENPVQVAARFKKELMWATEAAQIFAMGIFLCDGIFQLEGPSETDDEERKRMKRFFGILSRLHLDIQMVLVNRAKRSSSSLVHLLDREIAFVNLARKELGRK